MFTMNNEKKYCVFKFTIFKFKVIVCTQRICVEFFVSFLKCGLQRQITIVFFSLLAVIFSLFYCSTGDFLLGGHHCRSKIYQVIGVFISYAN